MATQANTPNYGIQTIHPASTTAMGGNIPYRGLEWRSKRAPDFHVFIFNISARKFDNFGIGKFGRFGISVAGVEEGDPIEVTEIERAQTSGNKVTKIRKGKENQRYRFFTSVPQPILLPKFNNESNEIEHVETDALRYVVDMINPDNLTFSLNTVIPQEQVFSVGNDFSRKGIFFSLTNPPLKEDVEAAYERMEKYYNSLNQRASQLQLVDKNKLGEEVTSNPDFVYAARYFGKDFSFTEKSVRPVECPNCGEQKPSGRRFHMASFGALCVEPTQEAWRAAVNAGVKKLDDVPEDFRWKVTPKTSEPAKAGV